MFWRVAEQSLVQRAERGTVSQQGVRFLPCKRCFNGAKAVRALGMATADIMLKTGGV
jgi:hypothetical protein